MTNMVKAIILRNRIKCKNCGEILESKSVHDFKMCKCGACGVDGGRSYLRRIGEHDDWIELSDFGDRFYFNVEEETNG